MAKRTSAFDAKLERLRTIRATAPAAVSHELEMLLEDASPYLSALAAEIVAEQELQQSAPAVARALRRVMAGQQPDRGCTVAFACVKALEALDAQEPDLYGQALSLVRRERVGINIVDTAIGVRVQAAYAMARTEGAAATLKIVRLLGDPEPDARAGVTHALAAIGSEAAVAALYTKLLAGDADTAVLGAVMSALLRASPAFFFPTVAAYLADEDESLAELAAIALGESRLPEALEPLKARVETSSARRAPALLIAIALLRTDAAASYLCELLASAPTALALQVVPALKLFRPNAAVEQRVREIAARKRRREVSAAIDEAFGREE